MKTHKLIYRVPYADVDQMSVVYYANYFIYFERGRNELLRAFGLTYKELEDTGVMLPVIESYCQYFKPAHYDDELIIESKTTELKGIRLKMECEIFRGTDLLVKGYTWHVTTNTSGKPCRMPEAVANLFS